MDEFSANRISPWDIVRIKDGPKRFWLVADLRPAIDPYDDLAELVMCDEFGAVKFSAGNYDECTREEYVRNLKPVERN
jgi:hypothetical protein